MPDPCFCAFCQNAAGNFVGNLFSGIFTLISKPVILVFKCDNNVDYLKNKVAELKDERETVENYAEAVDRRGEQIAQKLRNWVTSANKYIEAADDLVANAEGNAKKKCFFGLCPNPISRYQLSKKAKENSAAIVDLVGKASGFDLPLSHIPAPAKEVAAPVKGFEDFDSRKDVLKRIMEALQSQSSSIIGVHGMPGMGKTMLAKEVKRNAEQDKLFDVVVMALVTRNADSKKIQVEIARGLGLDHLPDGITTQDAAERIKERLKKMKKVLIILDDIWRPGIDLEELGIPLRNEPKTIEGSSSREEYAECKILLTSRDSNVLSDLMGSQQNFPLHQLKYEEAWELLKRIVGDRAESDDIHSAAIEIIRECGGLPLAITTMAKALQNKKPYEWRDAVRILKRPSLENFDGISANVYSAIEVSYSHLESKKLKETFLLCCLMGHRALIQNLLKYGVGLGLFANTIELARDEVFTLISKLRASSLLIDDSDDKRFDMHDLIHDVAVSITNRDRHGLLLTGDQLPKEWSDMETMKDFKWIWLQKANINELPDEFESPQLTFFCLVNKDPSLKIQADFFKGLQRLKVLDLTEMHLTSVPSSICLLKGLHTLCFYSCFLGDISIIGKLKNLEILTISSSDIKELPREIGDLNQLKLLDLSNCSELKIIPQQVLARMSRLEELYLGNSFDGWEVDENENQRNASIAELKHLKQLTNLEVCIPDIQMIPKDLFFENLKIFKIFIGRKWEDQDSSFASSRILRLHLNASISFNYLVKMLLKMTEELHLRELASVKNVVGELNAAGFPDLKYLYVRNALEVQHIIKLAEGVPFNAFPSLEVLCLQNLINLEKIFQGRFKDTAFNNLRIITIDCCVKVKNLFSSSMARQLFHLQEISVTNCSNMEEIVDDEEQGSRNDIVEATELKFGEVLRSLRLRRLPKLSSLNKSCRHKPLFNEQVAFPNLEELQLSWVSVNIIWHAWITASYIEKLTKLIIENCDNLKYLFTSSMARDLVMLGHLEIRGCNRMGQVLFTENVEENGNLIFPQLRILEIKSLPKLERFCHGNCIKFPCLSRLLIKSCPVLKTFISSSGFDICTPLFDTKVIFPKLEGLIIEVMESMDKIWDNQLDASSFCQLNYLRVYSCKKLLNIFPFSMLERLQRLDKLEIWSCDSLEEIFESQGLDAGQSQTQEFMPPTLMESGAKFVFPKLTQLDLCFLHKLKALGHQMHTTKWPSLKKLTVRGCEQVRIFASELSSFPRTNGDDQLEVSFFWTSKATFPSLEELKLAWNHNMKEIWHGQHILGDYFPNLKVLELTQFPKQSFVQPFVQPFLFQSPNLEKLVLSKAPFHEIFKCQGLGDVENPALALTQLGGLRLSELELTCLWKEESNLELVFSNMKILEVLRCSKLKNLVPSSISFKNLTTLEVSACHELINLIEYSTAESMVQLTRMSISECHMLKEIMTCVDDEVKDGIVFSQLKYLQLCDLPRLASFCSGSCSFEFVSLEEVIVTCPNMQLFSHGECSTPKKLQKVKLTEDGDEWFWEGNLNCTIQKMFIEKVGYHGLENLKFSEFPELIEIWDKKPQEILPFKRLESLEVCDCSSLRYLLTTSMASGLMQLKDLKVANCATMEQVIIGEGAEEMFPKLFSIILESCPDLKCFYEGSSGLEFPRLWKITVVNCPVLSAFAASFSTDQKKEITTNDTESEQRPVIPTQPFFNDKVVLPRLLELQLCWMNVNIKWHTLITSLCFKSLKKLMVQGFDNFEFLFSSCVARGLVMLEQLDIRECSRLREIIVTDAEEKENMIFPQLNCLLIENLQNLVGFYLGNSIVEFPSLEDLKVLNCPKLEGFTIRYFESTSCIVDIQTLFDEQAAFPSLKRLTITHLKNLEIIWHSKLYVDSFCRLQSLTVKNCEKLSTIFPSSDIQVAFPNLEGLTITNLKNLEMIWHCKLYADSFCKLRSLIVRNCEKLSTIFPSIEAAFLNLEQLALTNLKNLEMIWHNKLNADSFCKLQSLIVRKCEKLSTIFPSIDLQVAFPNLERLIVTHLKNLEIIWHSKVYADSFCKLKSLTVGNCEKLSTVFPSTDILEKILKSLEVLSIYQCGSLEGIFEICEFNVQQTHVVIDTKFKELNISGLPRLKHVWNKDPQGILTFHNLESVNVSCCGSLKILFPASIGKILLQLQKLHLYQCGVEEIVAMGEQEAGVIVSFEFPQVTSLKLEVLPRLQCFYSGKHTTRWKMLKEFYFSHFNLVNRADGHGQLDFPVRLPLFSTEKIILQLEELSLARHDIAMICDHESKQDILFNIKVLQIQDYLDDELDVLPIGFLRRFCHLENLVVRYCNFKELFPSKGEVEEQDKHIKIDTLSRIKTLKLKCLPYLKHIWSHDSSSVLQNLETLDIFRCDSLIILSNSTSSFQNLTTLSVSNCKGMINLVSISTVQSLVQLESMTVNSCHMLTEIVGNEGDRMQDYIMITFTKLKFLTLRHLPRVESFCSKNFTFKFPCLEVVTVYQCPMLKIFSEGDLNTPLLRRVSIEEEVKYRSRWEGDLYWEGDLCWEGDLNTTIQKKYMEEVRFTELQLLMLSNFPKLMETWHINNSQELLDFRQLQVLEICDCSKFKYLLTHSMAIGLGQLLQLIVKNCGTMEQVIMGERAENKMEFSHLCLINLESCLDLTSFYVGSHSLELPRLNDFIVKDCPKMVTCAVSTSSEEHDKEESQYLLSNKVETPNLEFLSLCLNNIQQILDNSILEISSYVQNLRKLCVEGCGNLKNLLTSSMVKSFEQLNWLEIQDCHMMEEVILTKESMDEERMCKIFFPNLEFLLLQDLPKLTRFCSGNYLELPCLWKLKISKCPVLKTFISNFISGDMIASSKNVKNTCTFSLFDTKVAFPKLERLVIERVKSLNKIWNDQLEVDSFCQLTLVSVVSCEKLMNIFPFSMVERLQRLDKLQIWNCDSLEEILKFQKPSVSQSQAQKATPLPLLEAVTCLEDDVKDEIVFSKLKYLQLCGLPRLSSFCSVKCKFEFPFLEEVILMDCPSMQSFSMDEIRMPKLQKVKLTGDEDECCWDGNLNSTIQLQFMQKGQGDFEN